MAMSESGVEIKVQPEVLDLKAQEVTTAISQMEQLFNSVLNTVSRTQYYWIGAAGDVHRQAFEDQKDDITTILNRLKEHPVDLQKIANTYRTTESALAEAASQLSSDLID